MKDWIKKLFTRKPLHDKQLYVLNNGYALVKCKRCGNESIPWQVPKKDAVDFNERHPESMKELLGIEHTRTIGACRD